MFDFVSKHKRLLQLLLILFIVPPFAFWGIDSYQRFFSTTADVAEVNGQPISEREFGDQMKQQQDRVRALLGANFDAAAFDTPELRARVLDGMIAQRLLVQQAVRGNLAISNDQLREVIASEPAFQEGGKFSRERYEDTLRREGYTVPTYEAILRRDLILQQFVSALGDSGIASRVATHQLAALRGEQREVSEYVVSADPFATKVSIDPKEARAYYDSNRSRFLVPEQVKVEYVVFNSNSVLATETVSEDEIKSWYDSHIEQYQEKEERRASHILITVKAGASDAEKAKAREKAQALLDQVRKSPQSFAELAKKYSEDKESGARGGDLGYFARGMMVPAFENAAFRLKPDEISGLVESEFGFHIIRLTGIKPAKVRSLQEVRADIERELKKQRAGRKFAEAAETFSNLVYEQSDSLKAAADRFKLAIQTSGWVTRKAAPEQILNHPRVLSALFSDDAIKSHRNTEAIEVVPGTLIAARVAEHRAEAAKPFEEVRGDIVRELTRKQAAQQAAKLGEEKLAELRKGNASAVAFGPAKTVTREDPKAVKPEYVEPIFRADRSKLPAYAGVALPEGYAILRVSRVVDAPADEAKEKSLQTELARAMGAQEFQSYLAGLRAGAKIDINKSLLEKKQSQ